MRLLKTKQANDISLFFVYSRDQPLDNLQKPPELSGDEQWYDCETHSPVNLKDSHKTPPVRSNHLQKCPPAPCRRSLLNNSSSDEEKPASPDDSFEDEFKPLDGSIQYTKTEKIVRSPESKRPRLGDLEGEKKSDTISLEQSRYSDLHYCEVSGAVTIRRQASSSSSRDESDRRECKMQISYRVNKDSANDIQIALIVYKNNSQVRSRRNLMQQFKGDEETSIVQTELSTPSIRCQSTDKIIYTAPAGTQNVSKTMKRSSSSRNCLRF